MNITTDQRLKVALAKELPGLISIHKLHNLSFYWTPQNRTDKLVNVTEQEWDYIVRQCEKKLMLNEFDIYETHLRPVGCNLVRSVFASWQERAMAYFLTKGIDV